jgi:hypothetical protein
VTIQAGMSNAVFSMKDVMQAANTLNNNGVTS